MKNEKPEKDTTRTLRDDKREEGEQRRDDATGPLQDGENRGNTTRSTPGGGDHGTSR